eukprot:12062857-Alexandrium_andersonii.AAC.1
MSASLVGSEMCIRDRYLPPLAPPSDSNEDQAGPDHQQQTMNAPREFLARLFEAVSGSSGQFQGA